MKPGQRQSCTTMNLEKLLALEQEEVKVSRGRMMQEGDQVRELHNHLAGVKNSNNLQLT